MNLSQLQEMEFTRRITLKSHLCTCFKALKLIYRSLPPALHNDLTRLFNVSFHLNSNRGIVLPPEMITMTEN